MKSIRRIHRYHEKQKQEQIFQDNVLLLYQLLQREIIYFSLKTRRFFTAVLGTHFMLHLRSQLILIRAETPAKISEVILCLLKVTRSGIF